MIISNRKPEDINKNSQDLIPKSKGIVLLQYKCIRIIKYIAINLLITIFYIYFQLIYNIILNDYF